MKSKNQSAPEKPYFEVQAYWGMTKHMGGLKATEHFVFCDIGKDEMIGVA